MSGTGEVSGRCDSDRVAVLVGSHAPALPSLPGVEFRCVTKNELPEAIVDADVLLVWDFSADGLDAALPDARKLRWIHVSSAGVDHVLTDRVRERDVVVTNTRGVLDSSMAEYVLCLLLALVKDLPGTIGRQAAAEWEHRATSRLRGRRALVVGVGAIGRSTATLLRAVGLEVDGVGRTARGVEPPFGTVHAHTEIAEVVGAYDVVVVAAPLTPQTRGLLDRGVLGAMRPSTYLINVGRGELVDEAALTEILLGSQIAGAALDVFSVEPLPGAHPLWSAPNVIVSPHMAGDYVGWREDLAAFFLGNLERFRSGTPLINVVDKSLGYVQSH